MAGGGTTGGNFAGAHGVAPCTNHGATEATPCYLITKERIHASYAVRTWYR